MPERRYRYKRRKPRSKRGRSSRLSRRAFINLSLAAAGGVILSRSTPDILTFTTANISQDLAESIGSDGVFALTSSFNRYKSEYGCPHWAIQFEAANFSAETEVLPNGGTRVVVEQSDPGIIFIDPSQNDPSQ